MSTAWGGAPTGTIISFMGNNAPAGYLKCDGTVYNIADYLDLAIHFETEFGTKNNFGGDGTTTFAVPDLRGEFLRGTGTNSHAYGGSGVAVGTHQAPTQHLHIWIDNYIAGVIGDGYNYDTTTNGSGVRYANSGNNGDTLQKYYTARPTNTSVLYCIKY